MISPNNSIFITARMYNVPAIKPIFSYNVKADSIRELTIHHLKYGDKNSTKDQMLYKMC